MPAESDLPSLSVVVPMFNAPEQLAQCLAALASSTARHELIVVDDASTDAKAIALAKNSGAKYVRLTENSGPGIARNAGVAAANGEIIAFVDSDVVVKRESLEQLQGALANDPGAAAVFGSYDDSPASRGVVTEFRNLLHHYVHQTGPREASTFWAGCGAIRRRAFDRVGGFDPVYRRPSIEDIELGVRLHAAGERVLLAPEIQCKHLKRWTLVSMIQVDVTRRAIPWTKLLIDRPGTGRDLNLQTSQKLCVAFVFLALLWIAFSVTLWPVRRNGWPVSLALLPLAGVLWINRGFYRLLGRKLGRRIAGLGVALHLLYFFYSGLAYLWVQVTYRPRRAPASKNAV